MADIQDVIEKLEQHKLIRVNRRMGDYTSIYCPFHNNGEERKPSCGILMVDQFKNGQSYKKGWTHCFSCGYSKDIGPMITDLLKNKSIHQTGIDWLKEHVPGFNADDAEHDALVDDVLIQELQSKFALDKLKELLHKDTKYVSEEELASYRFTVPYMYERKLTDAIIEEYDIGVDMHWIPPGRKKEVPCITFPVRDKQGRTLFFCRRSIEGKLYNYPEGVTKPVYGIDRIPEDCKSVVICESCINALTARVYGYNAVALLGTGNSYQIQQLKELGVREFVICTDGDEAGRKAAAKLQNKLKSIAIVWTIIMPNGKDLNDLSKEEFDALYQERE